MAPARTLTVCIEPSTVIDQSWFDKSRCRQEPVDGPFVCMDTVYVETREHGSLCVTGVTGLPHIVDM